MAAPFDAARAAAQIAALRGTPGSPAHALEQPQDNMQTKAPTFTFNPSGELTASNQPRPPMMHGYVPAQPPGARQTQHPMAWTPPRAR
jgi:hypothetical protein